MDETAQKQRRQQMVETCHDNVHTFAFVQPGSVKGDSCACGQATVLAAIYDRAGALDTLMIVVENR